MGSNLEAATAPLWPDSFQHGTCPAAELAHKPPSQPMGKHSEAASATQRWPDDWHERKGRRLISLGGFGLTVHGLGMLQQPGGKGTQCNAAASAENTNIPDVQVNW